MNYAGRFDATIPSDGQSAASHSYVHVDSGHAPSDSIVVPDAHFLFNADFKRAGLDLVLSKDDHEFVLHDYFKGEKRATLASPDGAHLSGDIVSALSGAVEVAQAGGAAAANDVIGHVTKIVGSATAIRHGVSIILNMGDNVEKGDVVQCGSDASLGVTFIDGTVFGLSANARMVLNDMVYDPNGSNNSSLLSLVAGTITFVAGETARHGDMKVDTPVATMGIRGTAVLVEIDFTVTQGATPDAHFQVLVEPDGHTGSYILFDKTTLQPIAVVDQAGQQINISNGIVSQTQSPLPPDVQKLIQDVFTLKFSDNTQTNPHTQTAQSDTLNPFLFSGPTQTENNKSATPLFQIVNNNSGPPDSSPPIININGPGIFHIAGPPTTVVLDPNGHVVSNFPLTELAGKTGDVTDPDRTTALVRFADVNAGDQPTVSVAFDHFTYQNARGQDVTAALKGLQLADIAATQIQIAVTPDPNNSNTGSASLTYSIPDNAFDFLGAGEILTLTYRVRVDNNYAPSDESTLVPITITITGTNDKPVITTPAQTIAFSGGTGTPGGPLSSTDQTHGDLSFTDVDLTDTHTVSTVLTTAMMSDGSRVPPGPLAAFENALAAQIATDSTGTGSGVVSWQLADLPANLADFIPKGQTLTLTYTVTVTDSQGATSDQTVTVTIAGTNNSAEVWVHTTGDGSPDNSWSTAQNWKTGAAPTANDDVIIVTDQLHGLTPSYPVTVDTTDAVANSVTMNDLSGKAPELDILSTGVLSVGTGGLSINADSIVNNQGTLSVAGRSEFLDRSVLANSGTLTLQGGGDFAGASSITNNESGTIEVAGGALNVSVDVLNAGQFNVDSEARLVVTSAAINGGESTGTISVAGTLDLDGTSFLTNGNLANTGQVNVNGTVVFDNEAVSNTGSGTIDITGALMLLDHTVIANGESGTETVESDGSLTLQDTSSIIGGKLVNFGDIYVEASTDATLDGVNVANSSTIHVDGPLVSSTLILDDGATISGGNLAIGSVGTLEISGAAGATLAGVRVDNAHIVKVDAYSTLTLSQTTISGGIVTDGGAIHVTGDSAINNAALGGGQVNIDSDVTLTLDNTTVTGAVISGDVSLDNNDTLTLDNVSFTGALSNGGAVTVDASDTLTLNDGTITGGAVTNDGTINSNGISAIDGADVTNHGTIAALSGTLTIDPGSFANAGTLQADGGELDISGEQVGNTGTVASVDGGLLKLVSSTIDNTGDGAVTIGAGSTLDLDTSAISGGTLMIGGTLDNVAGHSTITSAIVEDGGSIKVSGGSLDLAGALTGGAQITGASTLELGASDPTAYADLTVTFGAGSTGTLLLDHAQNFEGTVSGLDDNSLDLADIAYASNPTISYANGILSVFVAGADVANIHLTGDYSGVHWVLGDDGGAAHGTTIIEAPGAISGLDANGNADEGATLTASITDGGASVTDAHYDWQVSNDGGSTWLDAGGANGQASYTPVGGEEGQLLRVAVSFTEADGHTETSTVSAGTVQEGPNDLVTTLTASTAAEGAQISVVSVTDGGVSVTPSATYSWQVFDGTNWTQVDSHSYYAPTEQDEGKQLRLVTSYVESSGDTEQTINSLGTVKDIAPTLVAPFTFAVDEFKVVKQTANGPAVFDDTFGQAPPAGGQFGNSQVSFITQGSTWTVSDHQAFMSPADVIALPTVNGAEVIARLNTNTQDESVSAGGLKESTNFTVGARFDLLVPPLLRDQYGIDLNNQTAMQPNDNMVQLKVVGDGEGGATVELVQADFATTTFDVIASQSLAAAQLSGNTQIELDLAHPTTNSQTIVGSFELLNSDGNAIYQQTFAPETPAHVFDNVTYTRADMFAFWPTGVAISGQAEEGQTLTASATTNDSDATVHYQWQHSSDGQHWTTIGTDSATYLVQQSDQGSEIRVTATTADSDSSRAPATATSAPTAMVGDPTVTITVETPNGLQFANENMLAKMGAGTVHAGDATSFTVVDTADHIQFVLHGSGFTYDGDTVTGGTLTSFEQFTTDDTPAPLANFTGFSVNAGTWMTDVQQDAAGTKGPLDAIISAYAINFIGGAGDDSFGAPAPAGGHNTLTGGGGSDLFQYSKGYGAVTITDFDQGNTGTFDASEGDKIELDGFAGKPTVTDDGHGDVVADFGNGDVLTLLHVSQAQIESLDGSGFIFDGGGGNNGGPVISGADNSVTYTGTPVLIDSSVAVSDTTSTIDSVNVWMSSGYQAGDQLTINGNADGVIQDADGSTIYYHFDPNPPVGENGGGIFLQVASGTATAADFDAALHLINFTSTAGDPTAGGTDLARTISWAAHDIAGQYSATPTTTVNLDIAPHTAPVLSQAVLFNAGTVNSNGNYMPQVSGDGSSIQLTDTNYSEATSWYAPNKVAVDSFHASFDYQAPDAAGTEPADGIAFILQNAGSNALGGAGGSLGYGADDYAGIPAITPSAAIELNLYDGHVQGTNLAIDGNTFNYNSTSPVDFWDSGDKLHVDLAYDGSVLTETLTDLATADAYSASYNVNLAAVLGSDAAYLGFSGGTGALYANQIVSNLTFTQGAAYEPGESPVAVDPTLALTDVDSTTLAHATVQISGNLHAGEDALGFTNDDATAFGDIHAAYTAATGALTLTSDGATATLAQWQNALDAVTYADNAENPSLGPRTISYQVDDGAAHNNLSNLDTVSVDVIQHAAPVIETDKLIVTQNDGGATIGGLQVNDTDPLASNGIFTFEATTADAPRSSIGPAAGSGSLEQINSLLSDVNYNQSDDRAPADMVNLKVTDSFGASETVHFIFSENGSSSVTLQGTTGNDVIFATGHNDTLTGNGGIDQFVFKPASGLGVAQHAIMDFNTNLDAIDLRQFGNISTTDDALATATQQGSDTLLTVDSHNSILLKNVIAANLHANDFIVTPHYS